MYILVLFLNIFFCPLYIFLNNFILKNKASIQKCKITTSILLIHYHGKFELESISNNT